jgi:hypothetical protein
MNILTIFNSIAIIFILVNQKIIDITIRKDTTYNDILVAYFFYFKNKRYFKIPIRNKHKTELREEVYRLINNATPQGRLQTLSAKFSWLRTWEEVRQFEKDYSTVDRVIVERLVSSFIPRK